MLQDVNSRLKDLIGSRVISLESFVVTGYKINETEE